MDWIWGYVTKIYEFPPKPHRRFSDFISLKCWIILSVTVPTIICIYIYIYIYIYIIKSYFISKRERERERERESWEGVLIFTETTSFSVYNSFSKSGLVGTVKFQRIYFRILLCGFGENPEILVTRSFEPLWFTTVFVYWSSINSRNAIFLDRFLNWSHAENTLRVVKRLVNIIRLF